MLSLFCGLDLRETKQTHTMYLVQRAKGGVGGTVTVVEFSVLTSPLASGVLTGSFPRLIPPGEQEHTNASLKDLFWKPKAYFWASDCSSLLWGCQKTKPQQTVGSRS